MAANQTYIDQTEFGIINATTIKYDTDKYQTLKLESRKQIQLAMMKKYEFSPVNYSDRLNSYKLFTIDQLQDFRALIEVFQDKEAHDSRISQT